MEISFSNATGVIDFMHDETEIKRIMDEARRVVSPTGCIFVAFYARDNLGRLVVVGVTGMMFAHSMQNMGMNVLMMPITGLPLPFISYGGAFLVVSMFLMGMVQSVWIHRNVSPVNKPRRDDDRPEEQDEF